MRFYMYKIEVLVVTLRRYCRINSNNLFVGRGGGMQKIKKCGASTGSTLVSFRRIRLSYEVQHSCKRMARRTVEQNQFLAGHGVKKIQEIWLKWIRLYFATL